MALVASLAFQVHQAFLAFQGNQGSVANRALVGFLDFLVHQASQALVAHQDLVEQQVLQERQVHQEQTVYQITSSYTKHIQLINQGILVTVILFGIIQPK